MEWGLTIACDSRVLFQNITSFTKNPSDFADTGQILSILYAYRNMGLAYLQTGRPNELGDVVDFVDLLFVGADFRDRPLV